MSDEELANGTVKWTWMKPIIAERDAAYAQGYSDAEAEISNSALAQKIDFLHSQYANAADYIKVLNAERDGLLRCVTDNHVALCRAEKAEADNARLREALADALDAWDTHNKHGDPMQGRWVHDARAALKGEGHD